MKLTVTRDFGAQSSTFRVEVDDSEIEGYFDSGFQGPAITLASSIKDSRVDALERLLALAKDSVESAKPEGGL